MKSVMSKVRGQFALGTWGACIMREPLTPAKLGVVSVISLDLVI